MATLAQLQAEPWWNREIVTPELDWLGGELCRRTGQPRTAAGTKGDQYHLSGAHRSQEWILNSRYATNRTYTVQAGLTAGQVRHVAGFDFTPGNAAVMVAQCQRLMAALKAGHLEQVREFYGNVDGDRVVDGWNNLADRAATSDSSHLWHWHLSFDRRALRDRALMERILAITLGEDKDMIPKDVWDHRLSGKRDDGSVWNWSTGELLAGANDAAWRAVAAGERIEAQLAALAARPIDPQVVRAAIGEALSAGGLGELRDELVALRAEVAALRERAAAHQRAEVEAARAAAERLAEG